MGNIWSCCQKPSASPNASPCPGKSVQVNQVVDDSDVCDPSTRKSVAVPPAIAVLDYVELGDLDFEEGQPVLRMSDLKMPAGKETPGVLCCQVDLCPNAPRVPWKGATTSGSLLPGAGFPMLALPGVPTPYSFLHMCGQFLSLFTTQTLRFFFCSHFISKPKTVLLKALLISVGLYEDVTYPYGT